MLIDSVIVEAMSVVEVSDAVPVIEVLEAVTVGEVVEAVASGFKKEAKADMVLSSLTTKVEPASIKINGTYQTIQGMC